MAVPPPGQQAERDAGRTERIAQRQGHVGPRLRPGLGEGAGPRADQGLVQADVTRRGYYE